jgi:hypothetical protein
LLRIPHSDNHIEIRRQSGGKAVSASHFLRFTESVSDLNTQNVAVAYALEFLPNVATFDPKKALAKQLKIVTGALGTVAVYFPAEKETSGLRFHLHAPFVPELSRASIKETTANEPLYAQLGKLAAASLHKIRDLGLLNSEFLGVLPNLQDKISERYQGIRIAIIKEMKNEDLTPTHSKSHAPATFLFRTSAALKELLSAEDLAFLVDHNATSGRPQPQWAASAQQKNSPADRFLDALEIEEWEISHLVEKLEEKTSIQREALSDPYFLAWLGGKSAEWHQQLYFVLGSDLILNAPFLKLKEVNRLKYLKFVRLSDGTYSTSGKCYFPTVTVTHDQILPRVSADIYSSGKSKIQQQGARNFLEQIGVREVGEAEEIQAILKQRYTRDGHQKDLLDIERFIALLESDPSQARLFAGYYVFFRADDQWGLPQQLFLDAPYQETGLQAFYDSIGNIVKRVALSSRYKERGIDVEKLKRFAEAIGVESELAVVSTDVSNHPQADKLREDTIKRRGSLTKTRVDEDWIIHNLQLALESRSVAISRLIWQTMRKRGARALEAKYSPNRQLETKVAPSSLVLMLRDHAWIPQGDQSFVKPEDASLRLLPTGFPLDAGDESWIRAIDFGVAEQRESVEHKQKESKAKDLGFSDVESLDRARQFAALPPEKQMSILAELQQRHNLDLPENEPQSLERRAEKLRRMATAAVLRTTETRERSVVVGIADVKTQAEQYLLGQYTNEDGVLICQICQTALPFKLANGTYYFEKVEFLEELKRRHRENYVALCPNHSAMFQYANESDDLKKAFFSMKGVRLAVRLAQSETTIYFTKTHIADLKTLVEEDERENVTIAGTTTI